MRVNSQVFLVSTANTLIYLLGWSEIMQRAIGMDFNLPLGLMAKI